MGYTSHMNLLEIPTGVVDLPAALNYNSSIIEQGRTIRIIADATFTRGDAFRLSTGSTALKASRANATSMVVGVILADMAASAEGFGLTLGLYKSTGSTWGIGKMLYVSSNSTLTTARAEHSPPIGFTISSTQAIITPQTLVKQAGLTTETTAAISTATWGQTEADILGNLRTRVGEIQTVLINLNLIAS